MLLCWSNLDGGLPKYSEDIREADREIVRSKLGFICRNEAEKEKKKEKTKNAGREAPKSSCHSTVPRDLDKKTLNGPDPDKKKGGEKGLV